MHLLSRPSDAGCVNVTSNSPQCTTYITTLTLKAPYGPNCRLIHGAKYCSHNATLPVSILRTGAVNVHRIVSLELALGHFYRATWAFPSEELSSRTVISLQKQTNKQ